MERAGNRGDRLPMAVTGTPEIAWLLVSVFGSSVVSVMLNSRLISVLQSKHHALWQDLDAPDFWHVLLFGGKPFGGIPAPSAGGVLGSRYFTWLALAGYKDIDDPVVTKIGERLRELFSRTLILSATGMVCLCVYCFTRMIVKKYPRCGAGKLGGRHATGNRQKLR